jgi:S-adenosyl-L-methionine hydrolase (adenosine-forming)
MEAELPVQTHCKEPRMRPLICLTSDFGLDDTWVGVCHAVIYQGCPDAHVVDLSHGVPPYDVRKGAAVASSGVHQLPGAIHVVVVDPGVGGERRDICIVTKNGTRLLGPDNGVLLPAASRAGGVDAAFAIEQSFSGVDPTPTFHARDVLAPAAAAIASGASPSELGSPVRPEDLAPAPFAECISENGYTLGEVLEADRFGSLRFNIPGERIDELGLRSARLEIGLGHNALDVPFARTFSDAEEGEPVVLVDASGWLTLAINQGDAQDRYSAAPGSRVRIRAL